MFNYLFWIICSFFLCVCVCLHICTRMWGLIGWLVFIYIILINFIMMCCFLIFYMFCIVIRFENHHWAWRFVKKIAVAFNFWFRDQKRSGYIKTNIVSVCVVKSFRWLRVQAKPFQRYSQICLEVLRNLMYMVSLKYNIFNYW